MAEHSYGKLASAQMKIEKTGSFLTYVQGFDFGSDAILLIADYYAVTWLMREFADLLTRPSTEGSSFIIGNAQPVTSDGHCEITICLNDDVQANELVRKSATEFEWSISRSAVEHYRNLLSGMLTPAPNHQYLEPGNSPPAPVLIVSRDEYSLDQFRSGRT
jgi:hypothetical protein